MNYAYIRVSTDKQDFANQQYAILEYANKNEIGNIDFLSESVSGKKSWKVRALAEMIDKTAAGDTLIVAELSRLGRSMLEIFELISILLRKNVDIHVTKGNILLKNDIQSKVFTFAFSLAAEIERDLISQRTKEALAAKRANGKKLGRPFGSKSSKLDDRIKEIQSLTEKKISVSSIAKILQIPQSTLYYFCKTRNLLKAEQKQAKST